MSTVFERTKHKAQVYDVALNAFFKARALDAESLGTSRTEVGWDIAEAMVAAAISGVTYKSRDPATLADAALLLRGLADQVEHNGLADLSWGYGGGHVDPPRLATRYPNGRGARGSGSPHRCDHRGNDGAHAVPIGRRQTRHRLLVLRADGPGACPGLDRSASRQRRCPLRDGGLNSDSRAGRLAGRARRLGRPTSPP